jgi:FkbM family methyltransferase
MAEAWHRYWSGSQVLRVARPETLRWVKAAYAMTHPWCWRGLIRGVAPSLEHRRVLQSLSFDLLLDIGASRGQFSLMTRRLFPRIPIHAYEPQPGEAAIYHALFSGDCSVQLHVTALGDVLGVGDLHVSARADSSSLLPIGDLQQRLFKGTNEVALLEVPVATLDSLEPHWQKASRALMKLDVQGCELNVLRGARLALQKCAYVYAECSQVELYRGQALFPDVASFLADNLFALRSRHNECFEGGALIQADYLFSRH